MQLERERETMSRERETVEDCARALNKLLWRLPEAGCVDKEHTRLYTDATTRPLIEDLHETVKQYLGLTVTDA